MERYCTKCGRITVKKNDNQYTCEAGHDNWINPVMGAIVYVVRDGKVLFGVRSFEPNKGKLSLPGGFINVGETAEQAALREAKEELGIDVSLQDYLGTYLADYDDRSVLNIVYIATTKDEVCTPGDDMSGGDPEWHDISNLPTADRLAWGWYQNTLDDLRVWWEQQQNSK